MAESADMISMFLENDYYTDSMIADELYDIFGGATLTSQFLTQAMIIGLYQNPETLKKVREEFKTVADKQTMNFSLLAEDKCDFLSKVISLDSISDCEYLSWVMQESLRM